MATCERCGKTVSWVSLWEGKYCESCYTAVQSEEAERPEQSDASDLQKSADGGGMLLLFALALLAFCGAGLGLLIALFQVDLGLLILSVTCAVSGVLFLALNRIIAALEAIRDALAPETAFPHQVAARQGAAAGDENAKAPQNHP